MLETFPRALPLREVPDFLAGGGEMGERMRAFPWTRTPLGAPSQWPQALCHAVRVMLASRQPMCLWWGESLTTLYNDACRALIGEGHPSALGMGASVVWGERWDEMGFRAEAAIRRHEGSITRPLRFLVERQGQVLESHFSLACHAVPAERGEIGGALWTFSEATAAVLRERELACVDALRRALIGADDVACIGALSCEALGRHADDFPFTAIYAVDAERGEARIVARSGVPRGSETLPEAMMLGDACPWPLASAATSAGCERISLEDPRYGALPQREWDVPPREAVVARVGLSGAGVALVLVAGLNPYRRFDASFERFFALVCAEIAAAVRGVQDSALRRERDEALARIESLERLEGELRELDRRKNEFLATLAHELRNPLAPLRNGLEVIRLANGDAPKIEKARGMMQRQLQSMVRLVDDLLDVSRLNRGKIELRHEDVDFATVLRTAVEASQPLMGERGHSLTARVPPGRIVIHGDATRLSQVFWNLLNNAAKYTEAGGRIELDAEFSDGHVEVRVRDNGMGIPPEMQTRVFEIFTQVDRSLERTQGGLGIGLNIAKRLVEMHGGFIAVKSEGHRKGSEFTVRLPARMEAPLEVSEPQASRRPAKLGKRVLVADDNADSAETLKIMLEVMGNEVRVARDGEEAVQIAGEFQPDAILMDIGMPKLNGYDACAQLRARGSKAMVIALTGWSQEEDKVRSREAGFDRHLVKPVEPGTVETLLRSIK